MLVDYLLVPLDQHLVVVQVLGAVDVVFLGVLIKELIGVDLKADRKNLLLLVGT